MSGVGEPSIGPFSAAVKADGLIYVSGTLGSTGDVKAQTKQVLDNIAATLKTAGSSLANAASVTVYLKNQSDFAGMNEDIPYALFVSSKVRKDKKAPMIVTLHGIGGTHTTMMRPNAIDLAEAGGYILLAPMGYNPRGWYGAPAPGGRRGAGSAAAGPRRDIEAALPAHAPALKRRRIEPACRSTLADANKVRSPAAFEISSPFTATIPLLVIARTCSPATPTSRSWW